MNAIAAIPLSLCLSSTSMAAGARQAAGTRVYQPGDGVSAPAVVKEVKPQYTPEAMRARTQGVVTLECVVQPDGAVGEARVTKALNPGLDQEAIKAVRQWRFKPGLKDGKAVPVRFTLEMTFTLRDTPAAGSAKKPPLFPVRPPAPKALLMALVEPIALLGEIESRGDFTARLAWLEELKTLPLGPVWDYHCLTSGVPAGPTLLDNVRRYEREVLSKRVGTAPC